jgi:ribonuclease HI
MRYQAALLPDVRSAGGNVPSDVVPLLDVKATLFADGGSRGNPGPAASGAVLYDEGGAVLQEIGTYLGVATNNIAEWTALLEGLKAAVALGVDEIAVRMDSELVVKQLSGAYRVKHPGLIPLHAQAKSLLRKFARVEVRHVPRKQNAAADAVVNQVLDAHR